jgi:hypothetical protein
MGKIGGAQSFLLGPLVDVGFPDTALRAIHELIIIGLRSKAAGDILSRACELRI